MPADQDDLEDLTALRTNPDARPEDLPKGTLSALVRALSASDPGLRDDLAATTLVRWIAVDRLLDDETLRDLHRQATGPGSPLNDHDTGTDTVFGRSFTILLLALLHAADNTAAYLSENNHQQSLAALTKVGQEEQDLRAEVPGKGWAHMIAHAADLADELARSPRCTPAAAHDILAALSGLVGRLDHPFLGEEEDRIAIALTSLIATGHISVADLRESVGEDQTQRINWKAIARSLYFRLPENGQARTQAARLQQHLTIV
jgi:hypothetical protein